MKLGNPLQVERLTADPAEIDERLRKPLTPQEFLGLSLALVFPIAVLLISNVQLGGQQAYDFQHYLNSARGDFSFYYYAHWLLPLWKLLNALPLWLAYCLWTTASSLVIFFSSRMFGARPLLLLLSYQTLVVLYMGQFTGMLVGGLAILWWGLTHKRWQIAGIGFIIAASKYHTGLIPALALLLCLDIDWKSRFKTLIIPTVVVIVSLILYPVWPLDVLETYRSNPANDWGSVALWQWIGPPALLVWIPPLVLKMPWRERIIALFATTPLGIPYYQEADLLILNSLPTGWLPILGNLGFLKPVIGYLADNILVVIPLIVYLSMIAPAITRMFDKEAIDP